MLSVCVLSSNQALSYFTKDNYYSQEEGLDCSKWWGRGSHKVGVSGKVKAEEFKNLLQGRSPDGEKELKVMQNLVSGHSRRAGIDMTFSAPKSVTLLSLEDDRVLAAHQCAVDKALQAVEQDAALVRRGKHHEVRSAKNLVVAQFQHDTSRVATGHQHPDPQLHTHCVALSLVRDVDHKWMSLHNESIYKNQKYFGMVYQNELGKQLQSLGYEIEQSGKGTLEVRGYTRQQVEEFSKRTQQIEDLDARSKKEERAYKRNIRQAKGVVPPREELHKRWKAQCQEIGIEHPAPRFSQPHSIKNKIVGREAIDSAILHLAERNSGFSERDIIFHALERNIGNTADYNHLKNLVRKHDGLVPGEENKHKFLIYATEESLRREKETVELMKQGQGKFKAIASQDEIDKVVQAKGEGKEFSEGQKLAFSSALLSTDQILGWQGVAGAGKSYALNDFRELTEKKGLKVVGLAPDAAAAEVLGTEAKMSEVSTLASFLNREDLPRSQVWVVDEAGKVSAKEMLDLFKKASKLDARVILVGDIRQMSSVQAGNPFKQLQKNGMNVALLGEHRRQQSKQLKLAVEQAAAGDLVDAIKTLESNVVVEKNPQKRSEKIVEEFFKLSVEERQKSLILSGSNKERLELTKLIRDELKKRGELGDEQSFTFLKPKNFTQEQAKSSSGYNLGDVVLRGKAELLTVTDKRDRFLELTDSTGRRELLSAEKVSRMRSFSCDETAVAVGDRLRWTMNHDKVRTNGSEVLVTGIGERSLTLKDKKGREFELGKNEIKLLDHALVRTVYGSQGLTADHVFFSTDKSLSRESMYVGISRGKKSAKIFAESETALLKYGNVSKSNKTAHDFTFDDVFEDVAKAEKKWRDLRAVHSREKSQSEGLSI